MDSSRVSHSIEPITSQEIPLMPMNMEITSIEDIDIDSTRRKKSSEMEKRDSSGSDGN